MTAYRRAVDYHRVCGRRAAARYHGRSAAIDDAAAEERCDAEERWDDEATTNARHVTARRWASL